MQILSLAKEQGSWQEDSIMSKQPYRILVVDDEPDIMLSLKIVLENSGFKTHKPLLTLFWLRNFAACSYDLALLDIIMPKITGLGLYKELIKIDNKIKVCFLSAISFYHH